MPSQPRSILKFWEDAHWTLRRNQRASFLARHEVQELSAMDPAVVLKAVRIYRRLPAILAEAQRLSRGRGVTRKIRAGNRCSNCGAFVPNGYAHECRSH